MPLEAFTSRYPEEAVTRMGATEVEFSVDTLPHPTDIRSRARRLDKSRSGSLGDSSFCVMLTSTVTID